MASLDVEAVAYEGNSFLNDNRFIQDFTELYTYYKIRNYYS